MMTMAPANLAQRVEDHLSALGAAPDDVPIRHRRRGVTLEQAIQAAALDELAEVGYGRLTIESVAARARTGKASIYRRWPTKQLLVIEAFCAKFGEAYDLVEGPLGDATTRDALLHIGRRMIQIIGDTGETFRAASCELSRDTAAAAALERQVSCPKREAMLELLQRGVARGEVRPDAACELLAEVLPAMITARLIVENRPVADDYLVRIVDDIVMPLLRPV